MILDFLFLTYLHSTEHLASERPCVSEVGMDVGRMPIFFPQRQANGGTIVPQLLHAPS